ncbi:MAG: peptide deformylase [Elusimicrobiales bacterium]|nr:peptide deformylase [Elusimicrobiales bacterium]
MAIRRICKYGEDILRKKLPPCDYAAVKKGLPALLEDMWETLTVVRGLGLAASQIGVPLRLAVLMLPDEKGPQRIVVINPVIVKGEGRMFEEEGCLSLPGMFMRVPRFRNVVVNALNEKGVEIEIAAGGLAAKAFQHEVDHLDGKLFIDRLTGLAKIKAKAEIKARRKEWLEMDESKPQPEEAEDN